MWCNLQKFRTSPYFSFSCCILHVNTSETNYNKRRWGDCATKQPLRYSVRLSVSEIENQYSLSDWSNCTVDWCSECHVGLSKCNYNCTQNASYYWNRLSMTWPFVFISDTIHYGFRFICISTLVWCNGRLGNLLCVKVLRWLEFCLLIILYWKRLNSVIRWISSI